MKPGDINFNTTESLRFPFKLIKVFLSLFNSTENKLLNKL